LQHSRSLLLFFLSVAGCPLDPLRALSLLLFIWPVHIAGSCLASK
jgi:hypothetical protein